MIAWQCGKCNVIYSPYQVANASNQPTCHDAWCGGELEEIEISYDGEGLRIEPKNGEADG